MPHPWTSARTSIAAVTGLGLLVGGCGASPTVEAPPLPGRRVQATNLVAQGTVPYRVGAYELTFADDPRPDARARRAALLVDTAADHGRAHGFVEWGAPGQVPATYVAEGWARQRAAQRGELVTVFELALSYVEARGGHRDSAAPERFTPKTVRVVVHEASGDVTLTSRR